MLIFYVAIEKLGEPLGGFVIKFLIVSLFTGAVFIQNPANGQTAPTKELLQLVPQLGTSEIECVAFSPDSRFVLTGSWDKTARLWDRATGLQIRSFIGHMGLVSSVAFSPDGRFVLTGSWDRTARLWDVETGRFVRSFNTVGPMAGFVTSVAFSPDGRLVLTGNWDHIARLWDRETGQQLRSFEGHTISVSSVAFSSDGRMVLTGSWDWTARLWDTATGQQLHIYRGDQAAITSVALSPDGRFVLTGSKNKAATLWDVKTEQPIRSFEGHNDEVSSAVFSADGRFVLTGSKDRTACVWDTETSKKLHCFEGHTDGVNSAVFSQDGVFVMTGSDDKTARLWSTASGLEVREFKGHSGWVTSLAFSPDGRFVLTGGWDKTARLWDAKTGQQLRSFEGHTGNINSVAFSPDVRSVLTGSDDKTARLWDLGTGQSLGSFQGHTDAVNAVAFSADGRFVLTGSTDGTARLWDVPSKQQIRLFPREETLTRIDSVAFSPDGKLALTGSWDWTARLWDPATGQQQRLFKADEMAVTSVAFSPDGRFVLTGSEANNARLWDRETGQQLHSFEGHTGYVNSVAFSPDGHFVLTGSEDKTSRLWDATTGQQVKIFANADFVTSVAFSHDGRFVMTGSEDSRTRLWDAVTGKEIASLISFDMGGWAVVDPEGRFDTNDLDRNAALVWVSEREPLRPLPLEIFMRDYYAPQLLPRILKGQALPAIPELSSLNRAQPDVVLEGIKSERGPFVTVTVRVSSKPSEAQKDDQGRALESGVYDLRLFRDGQLAGQEPVQEAGTVEKAGPISTNDDREDWRRVHQVKLDASGSATISFRHVPLPRRLRKATVKFTAYAFNRDRVKSLTTPAREFALRSSPAAKSQRRAYLITMGVNANQSHNLNLDIAVSSAERVRALLRGKLRESYQEVVEIPLYSDLDDEGRVKWKTASKADLETVLRFLKGWPADRAMSDEVDPRHQLRVATPDDAIVLYVASHGYADPQGTFYLMPYDTNSMNWGITEDMLSRCQTSINQPLACDKARDLLAHSISSSDLASWWNGVDAGQMVMILDSCHSGAAPGREFRPGPLGDPGFGQLSYDKGMLILAASQPTQTEHSDLERGGQGQTLLVDALESVAAANPQWTLSQWLKGADSQIPLTAKQLYPTSDIEDIQTPLLLDFSKQGATPSSGVL